ncbi:LuxR C-terminal-related transcriptional regulator [uncultured Corynebacterium sp.]|uniref:helix-turn-helix transcriptional regulator n=1 Tax=uncultured Corynebacterium sp. TaxID=159447 RepID=UPI0025D541A9|nr:LuxR C-terminal-related transcriptional regulator [uncultured Corynebacterium sp.]
MKVKVLTVDEREVVRLGFESMIAQSSLCTPAGSCSTPHEVLWLAISAPGAFDVALLGLQTSINHTPVVEQLIELGVRIVLFRITSDPEFQRRAMGTGISAVVDPRTTSAELEMVLHGAVGAGAGKISAVPTAGAVRLSPRQREVLELYAMGEPAKRVATITGLSRNTVRDYLDRVRAKYALDGRPILTRVDFYHRAVEDGVLPPFSAAAPG